MLTARRQLGVRKMPDDPMLSQSEIDALLRSLGEGAADVEEPAVPEPAAPVPLARPEAPRQEVRNLPPGLGMLLGVEVTCSVDLGNVTIELGDLLQLGRSSLIVLDGKVDGQLQLRINGIPFAQGVIVETNGRYGMRITELSIAQEGVRAS